MGFQPGKELTKTKKQDIKNPAKAVWTEGKDVKKKKEERVMKRARTDKEKNSELETFSCKTGR